VVGFIVAASNGSYVFALLTAGGFAILGALTYLFVVGRVEPLPVEVVQGASQAR
jgi:MFS transporter, ACS family, D-galactonate transporter